MEMATIVKSSLSSGSNNSSHPHHHHHHHHRHSHNGHGPNIRSTDREHCYKHNKTNNNKYSNAPPNRRHFHNNNNNSGHGKRHLNNPIHPPSPPPQSHPDFNNSHGNKLSSHSRRRTFKYQHEPQQQINSHHFNDNNNNNNDDNDHLNDDVAVGNHVGNDDSYPDPADIQFGPTTNYSKTSKSFHHSRKGPKGQYRKQQHNFSNKHYNHPRNRNHHHHRRDNIRSSSPSFSSSTSISDTTKHDSRQQPHLQPQQNYFKHSHVSKNNSIGYNASTSATTPCTTLTTSTNNKSGSAPMKTIGGVHVGIGGAEDSSSEEEGEVRDEECSSQPQSQVDINVEEEVENTSQLSMPTTQSQSSLSIPITESHRWVPPNTTTTTTATTTATTTTVNASSSASHSNSNHHYSSKGTSHAFHPTSSAASGTTSICGTVTSFSSAISTTCGTATKKTSSTAAATTAAADYNDRETVVTIRKATYTKPADHIITKRYTTTKNTTSSFSYNNYKNNNNNNGTYHANSSHYHDTTMDIKDKMDATDVMEAYKESSKDVVIPKATYTKPTKYTPLLPTTTTNITSNNTSNFNATNTAGGGDGCVHVLVDTDVHADISMDTGVAVEGGDTSVDINESTLNGSSNIKPCSSLDGTTAITTTTIYNGSNISIPKAKYTKPIHGNIHSIHSTTTTSQPKNDYDEDRLPFSSSLPSSPPPPPPLTVSTYQEQAPLKSLNDFSNDNEMNGDMNEEVKKECDSINASPNNNNNTNNTNNNVNNCTPSLSIDSTSIPPPSATVVVDSTITTTTPSMTTTTGSNTNKVDTTNVGGSKVSLSLSSSSMEEEVDVIDSVVVDTMHHDNDDDDDDDDTSNIMDSISQGTNEVVHSEEHALEMKCLPENHHHHQDQEHCVKKRIESSVASVASVATHTSAASVASGSAMSMSAESGNDGGTTLSMSSYHHHHNNNNNKEEEEKEDGSYFHQSREFNHVKTIHSRPSYWSNKRGPSTFGSSYGIEGSRTKDNQEEEDEELKNQKSNFHHGQEEYHHPSSLTSSSSSSNHFNRNDNTSFRKGRWGNSFNSRDKSNHHSREKEENHSCGEGSDSHAFIHKGNEYSNVSYLNGKNSNNNNNNNKKRPWEEESFGYNNAKRERYDSKDREEKQLGDASSSLKHDALSSSHHEHEFNPFYDKDNRGHWEESTSHHQERRNESNQPESEQIDYEHYSSKNDASKYRPWEGTTSSSSSSYHQKKQRNNYNDSQQFSGGKFNSNKRGFYSNRNRKNRWDNDTRNFNSLKRSRYDYQYSTQQPNGDHPSSLQDEVKKYSSRDRHGDDISSQDVNNSSWTSKAPNHDSYEINQKNTNIRDEYSRDYEGHQHLENTQYYNASAQVIKYQSNQDVDMNTGDEEPKHQFVPSPSNNSDTKSLTMVTEPTTLEPLNQNYHDFIETLQDDSSFFHPLLDDQLCFSSRLDPNFKVPKRSNVPDLFIQMQKVDGIDRTKDSKWKGSKATMSMAPTSTTLRDEKSTKTTEEQQMPKESTTSIKEASPQKLKTKFSVSIKLNKKTKLNFGKSSEDTKTKHEQDPPIDSKEDEKEVLDWVKRKLLVKLPKRDQKRIIKIPVKSPVVTPTVPSASTPPHPPSSTTAATIPPRQQHQSGAKIVKAKQKKIIENTERILDDSDNECNYSQSSSSSSDLGLSSGDESDDSEASYSHPMFHERVSGKKCHEVVEKCAMAKESASSRKLKVRGKKQSNKSLLQRQMEKKEIDQYNDADEAPSSRSRTLTSAEVRAILKEEDFIDDGFVGMSKNKNKENTAAPPLTNWVRRSTRQPSRSAISTPSVQAMMQKLEMNDPEMVVLKCKKFLNDPDTPPVIIDAMLDALENNRNCQALYIQNFNEGMRDEQVLRLLRILQQPLCKIWCLNIGENYKVKRKTWGLFTNGLKKTNITHMYASEHTISSAMKEMIRDIIRENRKKHDLHINPDNLDVIVQCTHCWWNPINAKVLQPYVKQHGFEQLLKDKVAQGSKDSVTVDASKI